MKNCRSHFSVAMCAIALLVSCENRGNETVNVGPDDYRSDICWFNEEGDFIAFLAIAVEGRTAVPYPISTNCVVDGYSSYGEATLHLLNTVRIVDTEGVLQRALPEVVVSDNVRSDQPVLESNSKVYYFRARMERVRNRYRVIYAPQELIDLTDTGISFEELLDMSREERERLLERMK